VSLIWVIRSFQRKSLLIRMFSLADHHQIIFAVTRFIKLPSTCAVETWKSGLRLTSGAFICLPCSVRILNKRKARYLHTLRRQSHTTRTLGRIYRDGHSSFTLV
jgi:hypothetical protein